MEEHVYLITLAAVFGTVIAVFGMRAFASVQQAKLRSAAPTHSCEPKNVRNQRSERPRGGNCR